MSNKGAPDHVVCEQDLVSLSETRSCSRWAYEGEVEKELTGSLEQRRRRRVGLWFMAQRLFARHKKCILKRKVSAS